MLLATTAVAYQPQKVVQSRRNLFQSVAGSAFAGVVVTVAGLVVEEPANAIEACPKGSSNCIRTTWTPPSGTSKKDAAQQVKAVIDSYPQEGQDKVDLGGWNIVEDSGDKLSVEYKSGIGKFAKFFNGRFLFLLLLNVLCSPSSYKNVLGFLLIIMTD